MHALFGQIYHRILDRFAFLYGVRGYLAQGTRAHINLFQVRYSSGTLAASTDLFGKELRIYYNSEDLRTVRAFLPDGAELGFLKAQGAWGEFAHDLKLRREILKLRARKRLKFTVNHDFIERFIEEKRGKAKTNRRAASELERTMRVLANAPVENVSLGVAASTELKLASLQQNSLEPPPGVPAEEAQVKQEKLEPQILSIGFGYSSGI